MEGINIMVVSELLSEYNYKGWSIQVKTYLEGRDLWDVVEADEPAHENETQAKAWRQKNALALHAIQTSCEMKKSFCAIIGISSAKAAWAALADKYGLKPEEHNEENQEEKKSPECEIEEESNSLPKKSGEAESESDFSSRRENLVNPNEEEDREQKEIEEKSNSAKNEEVASGSSIRKGKIVKEVERISSPSDRELRIQNIQKARNKFTESHKYLVIAGEKWMKETASSCTVVGALIVTVTFAAAFTFPGGNDQNSGFPMFKNMTLFRVFTLSNAIALILSTTPVLTFLGIFTSRYAEEDFLRSLPIKLIMGLLSLEYSIAAMIIAFCVGLSIMFHQQSWIVIPSASLASIPVALFVWMQRPLFRELWPSIF